MEDVLTELSPPSRFFLDDLNNFTPPSPRPPTPFILFSSNANPKPNPSLLIVAISSPSINLFHFSPKTLIGTIILPEIPLSGNAIEPSNRDRSCNIYSLGSAPSTILISVQYSVSEERSHAFSRLLLDEFHPEKVLILGSVQSRNFRGILPVDETFAMKLETSKQKLDPDGSGLDYFPSGSVIDGLAAAILGRCEIKKIKGSLLVSWPECGKSVEMLVKSLLKDVVPDLQFGAGVKSSYVRHSRLDSELYA